ncbi:MAG: ATP-dependent DNA ligase [Bacteroidota bacterium]
MKTFSNLFSALESSNKTRDKIKSIIEFFHNSSAEDKLWFLSIVAGKRPKRPVKTTLMKQWVMQKANIPEWLFLESYHNVGDLGETLALLLPPPAEKSDKPLHVWMKEIIDMQNFSEESKKEYVLNAWNMLDETERLIFNKLIGGSFRMGVSSKLLVNALAKYTNREPSALMHSIMGKWSVDSVTFDQLVRGEHINEDNSKPYPFCLAYPLDKEPEKLGNPQQWQAEYKWDGIRGQIIKRNNEVFIWSRGEELINNQFPELLQAAARVNGDYAMDGEILIVKDGRVLNFQELQKRLNRKNVSKKMMENYPAEFFAYDLPELNLKDIRTQPLTERQKKLRMLAGNNSAIKVPDPVSFTQWCELIGKRLNSRDINSEGLMLKRKDSTYYAGRKKGDWWKWKVDPLTLDAVMIYAQKGSGRRSAWYTDYTFAVRDGEKLVTICKAYSGLTDKEIEEINRFVKNHSTEKFGPVRTVEPLLVFEIAFEGIGWSKRHKSGVALRFPRISKWRKDKLPHDIDTLQEVQSMINNTPLSGQ